MDILDLCKIWCTVAKIHCDLIFLKIAVAMFVHNIMEQFYVQSFYVPDSYLIKSVLVHFHEHFGV